MDLRKNLFYYVAFCVFFFVGAIAQAYEQGTVLTTLPDTSANTPERLAGYLNSYLEQKVNPSTMADVLLTEYIQHPQDPTGLVPLFPSQSVVQEQWFTNVTLSTLETHVVPEGGATGTKVGFALYSQRRNDTRWRQLGYSVYAITGGETTPLKIRFQINPLSFDAMGGRLKIILTNFGTTDSDLLYIPVLARTDPHTEFSAINTVVNAENALYLTITHQRRDIRGIRFIADYKKHIGIRLHEVILAETDQGQIYRKKSEIVGIFDYPTLERIDSFLQPVSKHKTILDKLFPSLDNKIRSSLNDLFIGIPIINYFFKYTPSSSTTSSATRIEIPVQNFIDFVDQLARRSQTELEFASRPALQSLILSRKFSSRNGMGDYSELMSLFEGIFVTDYNNLDHRSKYAVEQNGNGKYLLELTGERRGKWLFDLTQDDEYFITEHNLIPGQRSSPRKYSLLSLLNMINQQYYSAKETGSQGIQKLRSRGLGQIIAEYDNEASFDHLKRLIRDIERPSYEGIVIDPDTQNGLIRIFDLDGILQQQYGVYNPEALLGVGYDGIVNSQSEKIHSWITRSIAPWSNLQVPDERPVDSWSDLIYSMDIDRDDSPAELFLPYLNTSRPDALSVPGVGDTTKGWYMGNGAYDYGPNDRDPLDHDWHAGNITVTTGDANIYDIVIEGGGIGYFTGSCPNPPTCNYLDGSWMDNNGWIMYDLGSDIPSSGQWHVSFDFKKTKSGHDMIDTTAIGRWEEAGLGIYLTSDLGVRELMERNGTYSDDIDFMIPLHLDDQQTEHLSNIIPFSLYDPRFIVNYSNYYSFFPDDANQGQTPNDPGDTRALSHWPGGTLWDGQIDRYFHEFTYTHQSITYSDSDERGVVRLDPDTWYHVDIYYDDIVDQLNVLINGVLIGSNIFIPELNPNRPSATLENIWFYNYAEQKTIISNLEISEKVAPIPIPLRSSIVDVEMHAQNQSLTGPLIPYFNGDPLWETGSFLYDTSSPYIKGQAVNIGFGAPDTPYWHDLNGDGAEQDGEFFYGSSIYSGKQSILSAGYSDGSSTIYSGIHSLQGSDFGFFLDEMNYSSAYSISAGSINNDNLLDKYPQTQRDYQHVMTWDEFESLVGALLVTDYDTSTYDYQYPSGMSVPWNGNEYHEVLWGKAVDDILTAALANNTIPLNSIDAWGQVLIGLVSMLDAVSGYKVSPVWSINGNSSLPTLLRDTAGQAYCDDSTFPGFVYRGYNHDNPVHGNTGSRNHKWATPGYAGVVSYRAGGNMAISSFYAGDLHENVTYGGRKWYLFGLDESETTQYVLTTSMLQDSTLNPLTPFENVTTISEERLVIQGAREFRNIGQPPDYDTYSLHLVSAPSDMPGVAGQQIVVAVHWADNVAPITIYRDPTELFVVLEDKDRSGVFENFYHGPLGKHLAAQYVIGNAYNYVNMAPEERPVGGWDWFMEALSGLLMGALESLPIFSELWDMFLSFVGSGVQMALDVFLQLIGVLLYDVLSMVFTSNPWNVEYQVQSDEEDYMDGTLKDDGRQLIDTATGMPSRDGDKFRPWGLANNGLDDDFDQKAGYIVRILKYMSDSSDKYSDEATRRRELPDGVGESNGFLFLGDILVDAVNEYDPLLWTDMNVNDLFSESSFDPDSNQVKETKKSIKARNKRGDWRSEISKRPQVFVDYLINAIAELREMGMGTRDAFIKYLLNDLGKLIDDINEKNLPLLSSSIRDLLPEITQKGNTLKGGPTNLP
ncbi:MAG: hypothetical protein ACFFFG_17710 [Candidatus Thorarchaeota archaeon]